MMGGLIYHNGKRGRKCVIYLFPEEGIWGVSLSAIEEGKKRERVLTGNGKRRGERGKSRAPSSLRKRKKRSRRKCYPALIENVAVAKKKKKENRRHTARKRERIQTRKTISPQKGDLQISPELKEGGGRRVSIASYEGKLSHASGKEKSPKYSLRKGKKRGKLNRVAAPRGRAVGGKKQTHGSPRRKGKRDPKWGLRFARKRNRSRLIAKLPERKRKKGGYCMSRQK